MTCGCELRAAGHALRLARDRPSRTLWTDRGRATDELEVGVGPWAGRVARPTRATTRTCSPHGDRRNVVDRYRYWRREAIVADLDGRRHDFHVAIENWQHDLNIGTVVRTPTRSWPREVHIVGKRRWNRRGAMVTDRYQHVRHHETIEEFAAWAAAEGLPVVGIDNLPGLAPAGDRTPAAPLRAAVRSGGAGPVRRRPGPACAELFSIAQYGSTRSINAGVASGIAMHAWIQAHADPPRIA